MATMTNQPTPTAETRGTKRDKYPARSARIVSAGIALASTLGISSAYTIAAQAETTGIQNQNNVVVNPAQNVGAVVPATAAVTAPTQPAPAAVVADVAPPVSQTPVVVNIAPPVPQVQWTPPATSGSK
jgi:hypothetical protein